MAILSNTPSFPSFGRGIRSPTHVSSPHILFRSNCVRIRYGGVVIDWKTKWNNVLKRRRITDQCPSSVASFSNQQAFYCAIQFSNLSTVDHCDGYLFALLFFTRAKQSDFKLITFTTKSNKQIGFRFILKLVECNEIIVLYIFIQQKK